MDRDTGLHRTRSLTYGLAGVSLAGIVAVGALAQHATNTARSTGSSTTDSTSTSNDTSNTDSTSTSNGTSGGDTSYPTLTGGSHGGGAATSGGS